MKEIEDKQSFPTSSINDLLKGKSPEELAEIAQMAAIQCRQSASGKHSPASSEGSSTAKLPYAPVSFPPKWYQDSQNPYEVYEDYDLNLNWWSSDKLTIDKHVRQIDKSSNQNHYSNNDFLL